MVEVHLSGTDPGPGHIKPDRVLRRRYLIDPRRQLGTTFLTTSLVVLLLLAVNIGFAVLRSSQTSFLAAAAPQLTPVLQEQNDMFSLAMIVVSLLLVTAVAITTIVQTHKTAGAVFAVRQRLERVREGDLWVTLKLRRKDNLQDLETPFNEMVASLRDRASAEADTLELIASKAEETNRGEEEIANALRGLAHRKRQMGT